MAWIHEGGVTPKELNDIVQGKIKDSSSANKWGERIRCEGDDPLPYVPEKPIPEPKKGPSR